MALSETAICNMALRHLGVSKELSNLATDTTTEAKACRAFYETTRDEMLRAYPWPFATVFEDLALVEDDPTEEWAFSYRYPAGCLAVRRLRNGISRVENTDTRIPYKLGRDDTGRLIYTDQADATAEYTAQVTDVGQFDPDFSVALSYLLAARVAPQVTGGDPAKLGDRAFRLYQMHLSAAAQQAFAEEQPDVEGDSDSIRARN